MTGVDLARMGDALKAQGVGEDIATLSLAPNGAVSLVRAAGATNPQWASAQTAYANIDQTPAGQAALVVAQQRANAKAALTDLDSDNRLKRAGLKVLVNKVNEILNNIKFKAAIAPAVIAPFTPASFTQAIKDQLDADA